MHRPSNQLLSLVLLNIVVSSVCSTHAQSVPPLEKSFGNIDEDFILRAGLWKLTTSVTANVRSHDQTRGMNGMLPRTTVSEYCAFGKPGEAMPSIKADKRACSVSIVATSPNSIASDVKCASAIPETNMQTSMHSEMTLIDANHAKIVSHLKTKSIDKESTTDAIQQWVYEGEECGDVKLGGRVQKQ